MGNKNNGYTRDLATEIAQDLDIPVDSVLTALGLKYDVEDVIIRRNLDRATTKEKVRALHESCRRGSETESVAIRRFADVVLKQEAALRGACL
ncbi:hypothetical protein A2678_02025 [Candidatus Kaiserbacteria bacterium RIFCSPHIGHO2_01_FULL_53_31]|uniref:Uncharacterized protein n=1 Tax=Candidatus Kaiserbacteria bacterium RIFCSPHIGHO2_01_FULL_53_31 TaxID=1798481 RepID=A0A1F6CHB4_9BACT|nr:MAG: hypothetical protein A2678_02025 [Candidatus Kaiserbacteria bacterium RIFCSPHIGHO2_01_FULL_53_31]